MNQPSLFAAPPTRGTARKGDRPTSVAAARAVNPGPDQRRCLEALVANGGRGSIDTVCAAIPDRDRGCLSRRLTDLADGGYIVDSGSTVVGSRGRHVIVWAVR